MAKSIKLGADTYLDSTGVAVNNSGRTLADKLATHLLGQTTINNLASQSTGSINLSGVDTYSYIMVVCSVESRRMNSVILPTALANSTHFHVTIMYSQSIGLWSDCSMNAAKTNISITVRAVTSPFVDNSATYYVYGIL